MSDEVETNVVVTPPPFKHPLAPEPRFNRELLAAHALAGLLASGKTGHEAVAEAAVNYADYLIKRLKQDD